MASEVSSEKPKALLVAQVADRLRAARDRGGKVLAVCGPAVVHTGGAPDLARLVAAGWIDVLFAGNGFATHDIESNVLGTSLGVSVAEGTPTEGGHANHLRVINEVRRHGSIAAAVEAGFVTGGVMHACVKAGRAVRAGRVDPRRRAAARRHHRHRRRRRRMREHIPGVTVALMLASTLHAIATGNCLPAGVETFCVDINQAVVTKLADRGSHQALGIVTDVGLFVRQLADQLARAAVSGHDGTCRGPPVGAALPDVPAAALRRALRDQPVDAAARWRSTPSGPSRSGRAWWRPSGRRRRGRGDGARRPTCPTWCSPPTPGWSTAASSCRATSATPSARPRREINAAWFGERGWRVDRLPAELDHEGAGDALPFTPEDGRTVLLSGYSFRSDAGAATAAVVAAGVPGPAHPARRPPAVPPRPHVLPARRAARRSCAPLGWDAYGRKVVEALVPEPLVLSDDEACRSAPTRSWSAPPS